MKKFASLILSFVLCVSAIAMPVQALRSDTWLPLAAVTELANDEQPEPVVIAGPDEGEPEEPGLSPQNHEGPDGVDDDV